jgi:hypothetical protein
MKKEQLSERIGNIDDRLIQQAEHLPNYARRHRQKGIRRLSAIAAVFALMVCSFGIGAFAFAKETVVEVPVEQEKIVLDEIGLTVILPDEWKGKYGVEMNADGTGCALYVKDVHEGSGEWAGAGYLFWIGKASSDRPLTPEELYEWSAAPCIYLFSTAEDTYILEKHSDIQYNPNNPEEKELYLSMSRQIQEISFQIDNPAVIGE